MGKRARGKGVANAALRAARAVAREQDDELADIAQRVYNVGHDLKTTPGTEVLPLGVLAPLMAAAEEVAPGALKMAGLPLTQQNAIDAAAYLVAGFREMAVLFDAQHFEHWRKTGESAPSDDGVPPASDEEE